MDHQGVKGIPDEVLRSVGVPEVIDSALGTFRFRSGLPDADTVSLCWDRLDLLRGIEVFLNAVPGAALAALRRGLRSMGVKTSRDLLVAPRMDSTPLWLTARRACG